MHANTTQALAKWRNKGVALLRSMKWTSTMRALKNATTSTNVLIHAPETTASEYQEATVAIIKIIQTVINRGNTLLSQ